MDDNQNPVVPATDPNQGGMPSDQPVTDQPAEAPAVSEETPVEAPAETPAEGGTEAPATTETPSGDGSTGAV